jgi:hypothetical protein
MDIEEPILAKTEKGLIEIPKEPPRPPDFIGDDHNAVAWINKRNVDGEIITMNVVFGGFKFKLRKRFL